MLTDNLRGPGWIASTVLGAAFLAGQPVLAQQRLEVPSGEYRTDPGHTSATWRVSHFALSRYTARLTRVAPTMREHPMDRVPVLGFSGRAVVQRSAWDFTHLTPYVGDEVEVLIETEFQHCPQ